MNAPVIVFAYNRADHLKKTLEALSNNELAKDTEVFVFVDGPKTEKGKINQQEVLACVTFFEEGYFYRVHKIVSDQNKGLAKSVISGVTDVINKYGRVIVLEDDSVSDPKYLSFMNQALDFYENCETVWSIGGFTVPMKLPTDYKNDVIATQRVSSCAWGIWKNRWAKIDWSEAPYKKFHFSFRKRRKFNRWGNDRSAMYDDQMNGRINSWAIRFDYAMFSNNAVNIIPRNSLIQNIGMDGSGTHSQKTTETRFHVELAEKSEWQLEVVEMEEKIRKEFCKPFYMNCFSRMKRFLGNLIYKKKK